MTGRDPVRQRELRLFYKIAAPKGRRARVRVRRHRPAAVVRTAGRRFDWRHRSVAAQHLAGKRRRLTDPSNPGSEIAETEADLGLCHLIGWQWQNDALFRIRYRY